ncbi:copper homeostasis protein CutC [Nocardioides sp. zg-1228]|uniref:copper homeostasis protein CutC n=1 Tax=Nocardioides sp. zg-1228 TaxID=2763008 RepID=UPI0016426936|nr:copper homeostasis protein CutC [Nocardioides sp. zg-1228]MBC2931681.1 copper homeostasis protein CutC [Nocardioides sp. zg-1228]QSF57270.1 copper homeostasis protein CutC [Nocardioides sp. zg-1228]
MDALVEICLEDVGGAGIAAAAGADAVEVCAGLAEGGTTPTLGFVRHSAASAADLDVRVLVRARPGDFVHSAAEVDVMVADIEATRAALEESVRLGFVLGTLEPDGTVAAAAVRRLVAACGDAPVTFHKAFDSVPDRLSALALLADLGITRVLTAGGPGPALDHLTELAELVRRGGDEVRIAVGGGVRPDNVARVVAETGAREVHLRAAAPVARAGVSPGYDEAPRSVTSAAVVAEVLSALGR